MCLLSTGSQVRVLPGAPNCVSVMVACEKSETREWSRQSNAHELVRFQHTNIFKCGCSSVGRALSFQVRCREFESLHPLQLMALGTAWCGHLPVTQKVRGDRYP